MELHDKGHFWDIDALKAEIPEIFCEIREISVDPLANNVKHSLSRFRNIVVSGGPLVRP